MKVLYLGAAYRYMNLTPDLLPSTIGRFASVYYFGPNFVSQQVLDKGIDSFSDLHGPFDLTVVTKEIIGNFSPENVNNFLRKFPTDALRSYSTEKFVDECHSYLRRNREKVIVSLLDVDLHASSEKMLDNYENFSGFIMGPGANAFRIEPDAQTEESFMQRYGSRQFGLYLDFAARRRKEIIESVHFLHNQEFSFLDLSIREFDITVLGNPYKRMKEMYNQIRKSKEFRMPSNCMTALLRIALTRAPTDQIRRHLLLYYRD